MGNGSTKRHQMTQETNRQKNRLEHQSQMERLRNDRLEKERQMKVKQMEHQRQKEKLAHDARMEELRNIQKQNEEKMKLLRLEKEKQHQQALQRLKNEAEEKKRKDKQEMERMRQQSKDDAIKDLQNKANQCGSDIKQDQRILGDLKQELEEFNAVKKELEEEKSNFQSKRNDDITEWKRKNKYNDINQKLQNANDEITKAIEKTSLLESNVGKFLHLTQGLVDITTSNQVNSIKLGTIIKVFGDTLERETQSTLAIESFFKLKKWRLDRLVEPLQEETYEVLDDCVCDDEEEYNEIVDLLNEKLDPKLRGLEKRKLRRICLQSEKTWKKDNEDKLKLTQTSLTSMAPVLGKFFNCMYDTMQLTDKILSIEPSLNNEQRNALEDYDNYKIKYENQMKLKEIKYEKNTSEENQNEQNESKIEEDEEETKQNDINIVEEEEEEEEHTDEILEKNLDNNDKKIEKLQLEKVLENEEDKKLVVQTAKLTQAAVVSIHVVQEMTKEFEKVDDDRALNLAIGIQDACMKIVRAQGQMRQSIILAKKLLALKPSNLQDKAKKLWGAVDNGVIQIYSSVLTLTQTSAKFFGFFLNFNNSFTRFLKAQQQNCSLLVSSEYLQKDVKEFQKFSKELDKNIKLLGEEAMKCISDCITKGAGAEIFEKARENKEKYQVMFDDLQKLLMAKEMEWDLKKDKLYKELYGQDAKINTCKFKITQVNNNIAINQEMKKKCEDMIMKIRNT